MRRKIGLGLLYVAGSLVIAGSMYDLFVPSLPANLLAYQGVTQATIDPGGCRVQAPMPASANEALMSFRKLRRPFGSFHSEA